MKWKRKRERGAGMRRLGSNERGLCMPAVEGWSTDKRWKEKTLKRKETDFTMAGGAGGQALSWL